ncbi:hypothetical protein ON010_g11352 [Phytophthora cinnamomi]|nr:hypothetical protein ON010_g11352 [Phytophthora cinnamomi]
MASPVNDVTQPATVSNQAAKTVPVGDSSSLAIDQIKIHQCGITLLVVTDVLGGLAHALQSSVLYARVLVVQDAHHVVELARHDATWRLRPADTQRTDQRDTSVSQRRPGCP